MHLSQRAALAGGLLAAAVVLTADTAGASVSVAVKKRTLVITGNAASDTLLLRTRGGNLQAAGTRVGRRRFDRIRVRAGAGNDTVRVVSTVRAPVTLEGGPGDDTLIGGPRRDVLVGGKGRDVADGNGGNDRARLGAGDDRFAWRPGDGSDTIDGAAGADALDFTGSDAAEAFRLTRSGSQARLVRDVDGTVTGLARVERVDVAALGGADSLAVDDQSATSVRTLAADLGTDVDRLVVNGSSGDDAVTLDALERLDVSLLGGPDSLSVGHLARTDVTRVNAALGADAAANNVHVNGSPGDDAFTVSSGPSGVTVAAPVLTVAVGDAQPQDALRVAASAGADSVTSAGLAAGVVRFTADGGLGNDELLGGPADETFGGGAGIDLVRSGPGADRAFLGPDVDHYSWKVGDGSDVVDGEAGRDVLIARGSEARQIFDISPRAGGPDLVFADVLSGGQGAELASVEEIDVEPLAGSDFVTLEDVSATSLELLQVGLGSDGAGDVISAHGSAGDDTVTVGPVGGAPGLARVLGLPGNRGIEISGAQPADDVLEVQGRGGDNRVDASGLPADTIDLHFVGGDGNDVLLGGAGPDFLAGNGGADRMDGGDGDDSLHAGDGDDDVSGGAGNDVMTGGSGDDDLLGGLGNDIVFGEDGDDNLLGGPGDDDLDGGPGDDTEID